jgi:aspartate 1-decarboxylase
MEAADILPYEKVDVLNINSGSRFNTYAIEGRENSGEICLNGAAARLVAKGDIIIILTYHDVEEERIQDYQPRLVYVDAENKITHTRGVVEEAFDILRGK